MTWYIAFSEFPFSVQQFEPVHRRLCFHSLLFQIFISSEYTKEVSLSAFFSYCPMHYIRRKKLQKEDLIADLVLQPLAKLRARSVFILAVISRVMLNGHDKLF